MKKRFLCLEPEWPGEERIQALIRHSAGLFQWCSTAIKLIMQAHDPDSQLKRLVEAATYKTAEAALYALYKTALDAAGPWDDQMFQEDFQAIFGLILIAHQPLAPEMIESLLGLHERPALHTIQHFGSVLSWGSGQPVQILHPSFSDFLSNKGYCKEDFWFIDMSKHNLLMAERCFQIMKRELKFNICQLATSHILNDEIHDLDVRVKTFISPQLQYSCSFWGDHLNGTVETDANLQILQEGIQDFLDSKLLYWLECLSLMKRVKIANGSILSIVNLVRIY
jgi:hypothetical protein